MAVAVTGWSMLADLTDLEQLRTGERREGALNGLSAFAQTGVAAVAVWLASLALSAAGYHGTGDPSPTARSMIRVLMSVGTAVWLIAAIVCCLRYPLTRDRHREIHRALHDVEADRAALLIDL
jgi:GPH family glycoside/pentoside/hexuronide:cation symporter